MLKKLGKEAWSALDAVGQQGNKLANKMGAEAFWPMPLDKECEKAAAILRAFTKEGVVADTSANAGRSNVPQRVGNNTKAIMQIPAKVIAAAQGLAIFTVFRTGFHISGSGGSGILIARQPDGSWGPPSGIVMHVVGIGLLVGIDVYDTVLVLRTPAAVNAFAHPKVSLGAELAVTAGPVGQGGAIDVGVTDGSPAWVYNKSKGFYAGIAMDGTIVVERRDENERFYGRKIRAGDLIKGGAPRPASTDVLVRTIEMAEGKKGPQEGGWVEAPPQGWSPLPSPTQPALKPGAFEGQAPPPLPTRPSQSSQGSTYSQGSNYSYTGGAPSGGYTLPPGPPSGGYAPPPGPPAGYVPPRSGSYAANSSTGSSTDTIASPPAVVAPVRDQYGYPVDQKVDPGSNEPTPAPSRMASQSQGASGSGSSYSAPPPAPPPRQSTSIPSGQATAPPPRQDTVVSNSPFEDAPPAYTEMEDDGPDITLADNRRR
ncbi:hypothetical protein HWV62_6317 [Athelia sp. TMB]|nr:hypothetical protein HWV62_6317 [Athelia sp. TMB]